MQVKGRSLFWVKVAIVGAVVVAVASFFNTGRIGDEPAEGASGESVDVMKEALDRVSSPRLQQAEARGRLAPSPRSELLLGRDRAAEGFIPAEVVFEADDAELPSAPAPVEPIDPQRERQ